MFLTCLKKNINVLEASQREKERKFTKLAEVTAKTNDRRPNFPRRKSATSADPLRR